MGIRNKHATYANITATLALVVGLTGSAYAIATVDSGDVVDDSIKSVDLKNNAGVKSVDVQNAPSGSDAINADKLDGKSLRDLVLKGIDVVSGNKRVDTEYLDAGNTGVKRFVLARDGDLELRGECVPQEPNDPTPPTILGVFILAPEGSRVATDDGEVQAGEPGLFFLAQDARDDGYGHLSFSATTPDGDAMRGLIGYGWDIGIHECVVNYTVFK